MRWLDRFILIVLAAGVWALVLLPSGTVAHHQSDDGHDCSGTGWGQIDGDSVWVWRLDIDCTHI